VCEPLINDCLEPIANTTDNCAFAAVHSPRAVFALADPTQLKPNEGWPPAFESSFGTGARVSQSEERNFDELLEDT
jgi:hypothetical protein